MSGQDQGSAPVQPAQGDNGGNDKIKKFLSLEEQVDQHLATMQVMHAEAFTKAARAALMDGNKVNMKKLDDGAAQQAFAQAMAEHYVASTKAMYGHDAPADVLLRDFWLQSYTGLSHGSITKMVRDQKAKYTLESHLGMTVLAQDSITNEMGKNLRSSAIAAAGLTDDDKASIVRYIKADEFLDTDKVTLDQAVSLLRAYRSQGVISPKSVEHWPAYKKAGEKK